MSGAKDPPGSRKGPLKPASADRVVVVEDPPNDTLLMTPDEADISAVRMMDAADRVRKSPQRKKRHE
jgi:hypothetical protein